MNKRLVFKLVGSVMLVEAGLLLLPLLVSVLMRSGEHRAFIYTILPTALIGLILYRIEAPDDTLHAREGCAVVALSWLSLSLCRKRWASDHFRTLTPGTPGGCSGSPFILSIMRRKETI